MENALKQHDQDQITLSQ